ncbi:hypothetical protein D9M70_633910 [compost metagenome]
MGRFNQRTANIGAIFDRKDQKPIAGAAQAIKRAVLQFRDIAVARIFKEKPNEMRASFNQIARCGIRAIAQLGPRFSHTLADRVAHIGFVIINP